MWLMQGWSYRLHIQSSGSGDDAQASVQVQQLLEEASGEVSALHAGNRRQGQLGADIPDSVDAGYAAAVLAIHLNASILLEINSHLQGARCSVSIIDQTEEISSGTCNQTLRCQ